jgi:OFA family oxalate/formate antiporter-like MFS transporter
LQSELRQHWRLLLAASVGVICSSIVLPYYTMGALLQPLTEAFGWSRADVQTALVFSTGLGAVTSMVVGWLNDRYGPRPVALPGLVGLALGFFLAANMNGSLWMLYLAYGSMAVLGAGTTPVTWTRALTTQFDRQRGLALGIALTGTGVCAILAPLYTVMLVEHFGWRGAFVGIGLLPLLLAGPLVWTSFHIKPVAKDAAAAGPSFFSPPDWGLTLGEAARGYRFWILGASIFLVYLAVSGISPNLIAALGDKGYPPAVAAAAQSAYGLAIIGSRLVVGFLVDRFWAPGVALVSLLLPVAGCLLLASADPGFALILVACSLIGLAAGAELDLMAFLTAQYFGARHYAKIYAVLYAVLAVAGGIAPMLFAKLHDRTASYTASFHVAAALLVLGALLLPLLGRQPSAKEHS